MKRNLEDQIKNAVESWEERPNDIGLDNKLVWNAIASAQPKKLHRISWYKIAVAVILLLFTWGWGNTYYVNRQLRYEKNVMADNIQTLSEEVNMMQLNRQKPIRVTEIKTDTVVKVIKIKSEPAEPSQLSQNNQLLKQKNNKLLAENSNLAERLNKMNQQYGLLSDSLTVLVQKLQYDNTFSTRYAMANENINLQVDEEALAVLSQEHEDEAIAPSSPKRKMKVVLFNKSESSSSKAPARRGIRF